MRLYSIFFFSLQVASASERVQTKGEVTNILQQQKERKMKMMTSNIIEKTIK